MMTKLTADEIELIGRRVPECDRPRILALARQLMDDYAYSRKVAVESAVLRYRKGRA
jgi:hypothetical protein